MGSWWLLHRLIHPIRGVMCWWNAAWDFSELVRGGWSVLTFRDWHEISIRLGKKSWSLYSLIKKCQWCSWEKWNFSQGITGRYGPKWRDHVVPCRQCRPSGCADGGLEVNDASISRLCRKNAWRPHPVSKTLPETNLAGNQWWMVGVLRFPFGMLEFRNLVNREWREDSSAWHIILCWWCGWELSSVYRLRLWYQYNLLYVFCRDTFLIGFQLHAHVVFVQSLLKHHPGGRTKGAGATTRGNPGEIWASILAASNSWKWGWFWVLVVDGCRSLWHFGKDAWGKTARHTSQRCLKPVRLRCVLWFLF